MVLRKGPALRRSAVDRGHVRVALAGGRALREGALEPLELVLREVDLQGGDVLLEVGPAGRPPDRGDVLAARQDPPERDLARRDAPFRRDRLPLPAEPAGPL